MILNITILLFLLFMIYWWGAQGIFSAFLHLMAVIVAGTVAFALWEPLTVNLLLPRMPPYAWALGLLLPFVVLLALVRIALDKLITGNMHFAVHWNGIGGGFFGLLSGILTAGVTVVGMSYLPLGAALAGYQPYAISAAGHVQESESGHLWIGVDRMSASFFGGLSRGAFSPGHKPLAVYQPDLEVRAAQYRLHPNPNSALAAPPGAVQVSGAYATPTKLQDIDDAVVRTLGDEALREGSQLVVVDTTWSISPAGAYDRLDATLRVAPSQVRLVSVARNGAGLEPMLHAPVGFSHEDVSATRRTFVPITRDDVYPQKTDQQGVLLAWSFMVPADRQPHFLMVRNLRLPLPGQLVDDTAEIRKAVGLLGTPEPDQLAFEAPSDVGTVGGREGQVAGSIAVDIALTDALPDMISRNLASNLTYDAKTNGIIEGRADVKASDVGPIAAINQITRLHTPPQQASVRVRVDRDSAKSVLGGALASAKSVQGIWLTDHRGQQWWPIGYVWRRQDRSQEIVIERSSPIQSARQLPINKIGANDELYLYFAVTRGIRLQTYHIGNSTQQQVQLDVPR